MSGIHCFVGDGVLLEFRSYDVPMTVYYRVDIPGGDIYHEIKDCAGDNYSEIDKEEARKSKSRPCKRCLSDVCA